MYIIILNANMIFIQQKIFVESSNPMDLIDDKLLHFEITYCMF